MEKVAFYTLGCKVNQYETEAMAELFKKEGFTIAEEEEFADIYVINTCTVTNVGDRKSRQFIRRAKKRNEEAIIVVVGCYVQVEPDEVAAIEGVDIVLGTNSKNRIVELCRAFKGTKEQIIIVEDRNKITQFEEMTIDNVEDKTRAFIKIQEGCNQFCSYCIIPYSRGPIRSREFENIISEAKRLAQKGFKEIVLTGIHVASYGKENKEKTLIDVIEAVDLIDGIERIRLSSVEPTLMSEEFIKRFSNLKSTCDHFHLSLQSGSNSVLKRMNRKYTTEEYKEIVERIRKYMPEAGITTDIIIGFPGETDEEFETTCEFVKKIGFSKVHVFKYSKRKGTPAATMKNQIDGNIKNDRSKKLIEICDETARKFLSSYVGKEVEVLVEDDGKKLSGYTKNYMRVEVTGEASEGDIEKVKISKLNEETLFGHII